MRPDKLRSLTVWAIVAAALGGAAFSGRGTALPRADFAFCNQQEVSSLDPHIATGSPEGRILRALFEGLTRPDQTTLEALPAVAERWNSSADGRTWTFHLRADALWSNGDPVTAEDFAWSLRRLLDPATAAPYAYLAWIIEGGEAYTNGASEALGVSAHGPHELEIRLEHAAPYFPRLMSYYPFYPVHRGCIEEHGKQWIKPGRIVTNGPFTIVERRVRDRIRLERFEDYWGVDEVALRTVDAFSADGITTQLNMYMMGQVDWMVKPPPALYSVLLEQPDARVGVQAGVTFYRFNTRREPFGDPRVRRALALALDREALARDVMRGGEIGSASFVPKGFAGYVPPVLAPHDAPEARRLLAEAGFPDGEGFPAIELLYPHSEITRDFCQASVDQWRSVLGIHCHLVNQTWKVYLDSQKSGNYDVSWGSWIADYLDASTFLDIFGGASDNNRTGWAHADYDRLLHEAHHEPDARVRHDLHAQAEVILLRELPIAPVYQRVNVNMVHPRVSGFVDNLLDTHPLRDLGVTAPPSARVGAP